LSRLDDFVTEANEDIVKIVVLTSHKDGGEEEGGGLHKTAKIIKQTCIDKNIPYYLVFCENAFITKDDNDNSYIHNIDDKKGFKISKKDTVVLVRGSVASSKSSLDLLSQIERREIFCVNNRQTIEECSDKFRTILKIADAGLLAPKTSLVTNEKGLKAAFERVGETFPIVMKTLTGAKGIGVFKADTWEGMRSTLQTIWKINPDTEIILQKFIDAGFDIRVHVLGGKVIAAMKRFKIKEDFRSNYSLGGKVEKLELTPEQEDAAIIAAKAVGAVWAGVDIMIDKNDNIFIIEVNSSPGTEGIIKATGKPIMDMFMDYILNKKHWRFKTTEV
jgi:ribosomal protein S6--L-glutamate ligase